MTDAYNYALGLTAEAVLLGGPQVLVLAAKGLRDTAVLESHLQSTILVRCGTLKSA